MSLWISVLNYVGQARFAHKTAKKITSSSYSTVGAVNDLDADLIVKQIELDWKGIAKAKSWLWADGGFVYFNMTKKKQSEEIEKRIDQFRTLNVSNGKLRKHQLETFKEVLKKGKWNYVYHKVDSYGTVRILFKSEKVTKRYALNNTVTEKWKLFPMYMTRYIQRLVWSGSCSSLKHMVNCWKLRLGKSPIN